MALIHLASAKTELRARFIYRQAIQIPTIVRPLSSENPSAQAQTVFAPFGSSFTETHVEHNH